MKILAIDLGKNYGWCFKNGEDEDWGEGTVEDLTEWGKQFGGLLILWKPEIVVLSQTNSFGYWNASRQMLMKAGVAFYLCGRAGISGVELNDTSARKAVLGKSVKKAAVQALFPEFKKTPNALDAVILARGWEKLNRDSPAV